MYIIAIATEEGTATDEMHIAGSCNGVARAVHVMYNIPNTQRKLDE